MSVYDIIQSQVTIYVGILLFVIGVLGNFTNACIFFKNNLQNSSTFLLFLASCSNIINMYVGLLPQIVTVGFNIDLIAVNVSWCKMRNSLVQLCVLTSLSCVCYAIVDQFFVSSNQERWRRLSKISTTQIVILIIFCVWILYSIPAIIFSNVIHLSNGTSVCTIFSTNLIFARFSSYFSLTIVWTIGPISILIVFGILTYRNVSLLRGNLNRERTQRHLTSMILLHVIFIIVGTTPITFFYMYLTITFSVIKSTYRRALENLLENILTLIFYFSYSCSFFVYYFSSQTHRNQAKRLLHTFRRHRRVGPRDNSMSIAL